MKGIFKVVSLILCVTLVLGVFSGTGFAGLFDNEIKAAENILRHIGKTAYDDEPGGSVYDTFNVPDPPLWHSVLFFLPLMFMYGIIWIIFPYFFDV